MARTASFGLTLEIESQGGGAVMSARFQLAVVFFFFFLIESTIRIEAPVAMTMGSSYILSCFGSMERCFFTRGLYVC